MKLLRRLYANPFFKNCYIAEMFTVCKLFTTIMNKYTNKCEMTNFVCKECYYTSYISNYVSSVTDFDIWILKCKFCNYKYEHEVDCDFTKVKVRGICGLCFSVCQI